MPQFIKIPLILLEVVVVFNLMIIVHELGHFLAARWRGLVVEKFGIWFGKPLWKKTIDGVEYSLGSIPAGGFVALPQMAPMEVMEGKTETPREQLPPISALDKIIVAFAGPLFSFGLAVVFASLVWLVGRPVSEAEATTTVGFVVPDSPAEKAGLKEGDKILSVDGFAVHRFAGMGADSITWRIIRSEGNTVPIVVERIENGTPRQETLTPVPEVPETKWWQRKAQREIGIGPSQEPMVASVEAGSPADVAGLKPNDIIEKVNGGQVYSIETLSDCAKDHPNQALTLGVERGTGTVNLTFLPMARIDQVEEGSPAARAGLEKGDTVTALDGQPMTDIAQIIGYIKSHGGKRVLFTVRTPKNTTLTCPVTPEVPLDDPAPHIGVSFDRFYGITEDTYGKFHLLHPGPIEQVESGMMMIVDTLGAIVSHKSGVKLQHMGGPLMMFRVYYTFFQNREGWRLALWFSVVLNVNLALINLLPIPVLDGGHITLAIIEGVRRRPVNVRILEVIQTGCAMLIIGFMLYIAFFDAQDYMAPKEGKLHFAPQQATPAQHP